MKKELKMELFLKLAIFVGLLSLIIIFFAQKTEFTSVDLGRHIENGKIIYQDQQVLFKNLYSYTEPETSFINHHWLAGVIYYPLYLIGGFELLSILNILLILLAFTLAFKLACQKAGFYISALLALPTIFLLSERAQVRPETFSYLFIILTWFILEKAEEKKNYRLLYWLIPVFALWVNIHSYFFIGLILVAIKASSEFLEAFINSKYHFKKRLFSALSESRVWWFNLGYILLAALLNPHFIKGVFYPLNIFKRYGYDIIENKSVFYVEKLIINYNIPIFKVFLLLLIVSFIIRFISSKKIKIFELLVGIFFSALALMAIRNIAIFGLVAMILIGFNLKDVAYEFWNKIKTKNQTKITLVFSAGLLIFILTCGAYLIKDSRVSNNFLKSSFGLGLRDGNEDSITFFKDNQLAGPIFNNFSIGSALDFWLYPAEKVFVDNRPEAYSKDFFREIYVPTQSNESKWQELSGKYKFKTIYFAHTDQSPDAMIFLARILKDKDWSLVYFDRTVIIFTSNLNNNENIQNLKLDEKMIEEKIKYLADNSDFRSKYQIAYLANLLGRADLNEEINNKILAINPNNRFALSSLGLAYLNSEDEAKILKSLAYFQKSVKAGNKLPNLYIYQGIINLHLGNIREAESNFRSALRIDKKNQIATQYLNQIKWQQTETRLQYENESF